MRKIPTVFVRDPENPKLVTEQVNPGCEWVLAGEGVATRKYDGTCVMLDEDGEWWARREVKAGKAAPDSFEPVSTDPATGKTVGWEPIGQSPFGKFHAEALWNPMERRRIGTYELCGPKINGNPEKADSHVLIAHADAETVGASGWDYAMIRQLVTSLAADGWEGIVWHHPDGRMAKIKARDFPAA